MRKSKRCNRTLLQQVGGILVMRTCLQPRQHTGKCIDNRGAWGND